jgi:hypothetical protein
MKNSRQHDARRDNLPFSCFCKKPLDNFCKCGRCCGMKINIPQIWALWPSILAMSRDTGFARSRLYRLQCAGDLPPAALDLVVVAKASAAGVALKLSDLALVRWDAAGRPAQHLIAALAANGADA